MKNFHPDSAEAIDKLQKIINQQKARLKSAKTNSITKNTNSKKLKKQATLYHTSDWVVLNR